MWEDSKKQRYQKRHNKQIIIIVVWQLLNKNNFLKLYKCVNY